jgi:hypothetical protein
MCQPGSTILGRPDKARHRISREIIDAVPCRASHANENASGRPTTAPGLKCRRTGVGACTEAHVTGWVDAAHEGAAYWTICVGGLNGSAGGSAVNDCQITLVGDNVANERFPEVPNVVGTAVA